MSLLDVSVCVCLSVCAQQHDVITAGCDWPLIPISSNDVIMAPAATFYYSC